MKMTISQSREELKSELMRTFEASGMRDDFMYIRLIVSRGGLPCSMYLKPEIPTSYIYIVKRGDQSAVAKYQAGLKLQITEVRRNQENTTNPGIKSGSHLNNVLGLAEANEKGADDCLMLNADGNVSELSRSNVLFVIDNVLVTPIVDLYAGLTRKKLCELAQTIGIAVSERAVPAEEIEEATECFAASTCIPLYTCAINSITFPDGRTKIFEDGLNGKITKPLIKCFQEYCMSTSQ